jgi:hypothetical protein
VREKNVEKGRAKQIKITVKWKKDIVKTKIKQKRKKF